MLQRNELGCLFGTVCTGCPVQLGREMIFETGRWYRRKCHEAKLECSQTPLHIYMSFLCVFGRYISAHFLTRFIVLESNENHRKSSTRIYVSTDYIIIIIEYIFISQIIYRTISCNYYKYVTLMHVLSCYEAKVIYIR